MSFDTKDIYSKNRPEVFYKYVTAKVAKNILVNKTLRWSSPQLFNDPFDVNRIFDFGINVDEFKSQFVEEVINLISTNELPDLSSRPQIEWIVNLCRNNPDHESIIIDKLPELLDVNWDNSDSVNTLKRIWGSFLPEFRIICFSATNDNDPMWNHYSDSHKGVVLGFRYIEKLDSPWYMAEPVIYQDTPPLLATVNEWVKSFTGQKTLNHEDWGFYKPLTLTKKKSWEYEKEWRVVSFCRKGEIGLYSDYKFHPEELCSLYFGYDISGDDKDDITSLLKYDLNHIKIYQSRVDVKKRELIFDEIS